MVVVVVVVVVGVVILDEVSETAMLLAGIRIVHVLFC